MLALTVFALCGANAATTVAESIDRGVDQLKGILASPSKWETCSTTTCDVTLDISVALIDPMSVLPDVAIVVVAAGPERFVVYTRTGDQLLAFDKTGQVVARLGKGIGAASFTRLANIIPGPNRSVVVHDLRGGVASIVTSDLKVIRQIRTMIAPDLALANGQFLSTSPIRTADRIGIPLHLLDENLTVKESFGADIAEFRADLEPILQRKITSGPNDTILAVTPGRYVFEQWDPLMRRRLATLRVQSTWFEETVQAVTSERVRPRPRILQIGMEGGLLWSVIRVADTNWKPPDKPNKERPFDLSEHNRTYDWVIEAISPMSGKVLASRRFDTARWGQSASPFVTTRDMSGRGMAERVNVHRMNIRRKDGTQ